MPDDNQRLLQAIRVGNIGIFDHDHEAGTIFWSPELREMYGWDPVEPATLPKIVAHVSADDRDRVLAAVHRAHDPRGDGAFDIEHRIIDRRGAIRWVQTRSKTHFQEISGELRACRTIGAVQDVTERRRAEERLRVLEDQLRHAQKMESIGRLAGGIAHDFNNLMTVILAGIELGQARLPAEHASRTNLRDAIEAARSATGLTRQLLAFSRKEAISPRVLDLNEVVGRMQNVILQLLGDAVRLEVVCGRDVPPIWFDPVQVEQVILNLAMNARDAMPKGGRLTIGTSVVGSPNCEPSTLPATCVVLSVDDTGVGIADDVRARLFEPFFTTKDAGKGTGLGLAVVYGAVEQNGGQIEVDSELGRGSAFKVYFRAATGGSAAVE